MKNKLRPEEIAEKIATDESCVSRFSSLCQTDMNEFIINNNYQFPYFCFCALYMSREYFIQTAGAKYEGEISDIQMDSIKNHWGSIIGLAHDEDHSTYADLFEIWCNRNLKNLALPNFKDIKVINSDQKNLDANTIYLTCDGNADVLNSSHQSHLQQILVHANKELIKQQLFAEFGINKTGARDKRSYERWLDAVFLKRLFEFDIEDKELQLLRKYEVFLDVMNSSKECWRSEREQYQKFTLLTDKGLVIDMSVDQAYDEIERFFDSFQKILKQGEGFVNNMNHGVIKGGRS
ncbi:MULTISPECIES: hypothetical protein [Colwellia]|uniref:Uncharacterized protein n=1 Tax=Colwellia marinimaniae TaxID=1513592 RepID=A0ABQ0MWD6_9GAMM|nr:MULTISPECIES: hypothetical protein [Colwellia]GAW96677.1 hypothetical protein MTCD1_02297 [Colwellia marinimaniae]